MPKARLSMAFETLSGGTSMGVVVPTKGGATLRAAPTYRYPVRPEVASGNLRLKTANAAYWTMSQDQVDAWTIWGERHPRTDPVTGTIYPSDSRNAFVGLACKILQVDPGATLPLWPPTGSFVRQRGTIEVRPADEGSLLLARGGGGIESLAEGETTPTLLSPGGEGSAALLFTASAPTLEGRVVELMAQPLKRLLCKPQKFYKSHGFVAFAAGGLTVALPLPKGAYAVAVQEVEPSTGRTGGFTLLGKVELVG